MLDNIEIKDISPAIIYSYPKHYTYEEIKSNVDVLHKIADRHSNNTIYCLGYNMNHKCDDTFELCYPILKTFYNKYNRSDLKTLPRYECICADLIATCYDDFLIALEELVKFAHDKGYTTTLPYRIIYTKEKNQLFTKSSKTPPKYAIEIQIPIEKN